MGRLIYRLFGGVARRHATADHVDIYCGVVTRNVPKILRHFKMGMLEFRNELNKKTPILIINLLYDQPSQ